MNSKKGPLDDALEKLDGVIHRHHAIHPGRTWCGRSVVSVQIVGWLFTSFIEQAMAKADLKECETCSKAYLAWKDKGFPRDPQEPGQLRRPARSDRANRLLVRATRTAKNIGKQHRPAL
ncbi:MAG: hypothetical protein OXG44_19350, partial [Gammaproteobacteria bacterium]|nr:hypothetical protein [Gammaproteobacteria bacterium]